MTEAELRVILKARLAAAGDNAQRDVARALGVSPSYLSEVLSEKMPPGPKLLAGLGLVKVVSYEPVEGGANRPAREDMVRWLLKCLVALRRQARTEDLVRGLEHLLSRIGYDPDGDRARAMLGDLI